MNLKRIIGQILVMLSIKNHGSNNYVNSQSNHIVKTKFVFYGSDNIVVIGSNCRVEGSKFYIKGSHNRIILGDSVSMMNGDLWIEDNDNVISISNRTCFTSRFHMACMEGTRIMVGEDCLFAADITIRTGDSHSLLDMEGKRINPSKDVVVGNHVWIGHGASLNKGSAIASNCVVANASVVTKEFYQQNVVLGGIPAKIIKNNINWCGDRI